MKSLLYLNRYLLKYKYTFLFGVFFIVVSNVLILFPPQMIRKSFDVVLDMLGNKNDISTLKEQLIYFGILLIASTLFRGFLMFFMRQTIIVMSRKIEYDLKNTVYKHYQKLPMSFYKNNKTGDLMNRISEDVGQSRMYVGPAVMYTINLFTLVVIVVVNMFMIDVQLSIYSLITLPFLSYTIHKISSKINKKSQNIQEHLSYLSSFVQEYFSGIRVVKSYGIQKNIVDKFEKVTDNNKIQNLKLVKTHAMFFPLMMLLIGLSNVFVMYIGGLRVMDGHITTGVIAEFIIYINILTWPLNSMGWVTSIIQRASASQKRINEFLQIKPQIENITKEPFYLQGKIEFKNVSFKYENTNIQALKNISFEVENGKTIGILGQIGSGKSTICELLCRFHEAQNGIIQIDDNNISHINLGDYRKQMGYVPQDAFLFSDSIANNIAFGVSNATQQEIEDIAQKVLLAEDIMTFTEKYDTIIGERGVTLSGGQKQRVSIARAMLKKPKLLLLDDCLSALDTETENIILKNIKLMVKNITTVIVSHRISSVKDADEIIVLNQGEIIEQGTHDFLLEENGYYASLYNDQNSY